MAELKVDVECPCGTIIPVPIAVHLSRLSVVGAQRMTCEPDLTDLWAHSFTHPTGPGDGIPLAS